MYLRKRIDNPERIRDKNFVLRQYGDMIPGYVMGLRETKEKTSVNHGRGLELCFAPSNFWSKEIRYSN